MATCKLPGCNKKARKRFCCDRHKDKYHNRLKAAKLRRGSGRNYHPHDDYHPFESDALGQW